MADPRDMLAEIVRDGYGPPSDGYDLADEILAIFDLTPKANPQPPQRNLTRLGAFLERTGY